MGKIDVETLSLAKSFAGTDEVKKICLGETELWSATPTLAAPQNVSVSGTDATFDEVEHAESYEFFVDGTSIGTYVGSAPTYYLRCYNTYGSDRNSVNIYNEDTSTPVAKDASNQYLIESDTLYRIWDWPQGHQMSAVKYLLDNNLYTLGTGSASATVFTASNFAQIKAYSSTSQPSFRCDGTETGMYYYFKVLPPEISTVDLSTLSGWSGVSSGSHTLTIKAKATGYNDSPASTGVTFSKSGATYTVNLRALDGDTGVAPVANGGVKYRINGATEGYVTSATSNTTLTGVSQLEINCNLNGGFVNDLLDPNDTTIYGLDYSEWVDVTEILPEIAGYSYVVVHTEA